MGMLTTVPLEELVRRAGTEIGVSDYVSISQETFNAFAEVTGDRQWIHCDPLRAAGSPFRWDDRPRIPHACACAHLARSGAPAWRLRHLAVNYGLDKLRFPAPLPVGEQVRMWVALDAANPIPNGVALSLSLIFERPAGGKPVCVANVIYHVYE